MTSPSGLRIQLPEAACRLQMWLGSGMAGVVAVASNYSSNWTSSLGTCKCCKYGPKKKKRMPNPRSQKFSSVFSFRCFMALSITFRSLFILVNYYTRYKVGVKVRVVAEG